MDKASHKPRMTAIWAKVFLLIALATFCILFVILNLNVVLEPRLHLVFVRYERPGFLLVFMVTALVTLVGSALVRAGFRVARQLREAKTSSLESEIAALKDQNARGGQVRDTHTADDASPGAPANPRRGPHA